MSRSFLVWAWILCGIVSAGEAPPETPPVGLDALLGFDKLPLLTDWPAYQDSSYHRSNINQDAGNFLRVEKNGDQVLTDTDGPGVVYRIWSTGVVGRQLSETCRLRFYFDGEAEPRLGDGNLQTPATSTPATCRIPTSRRGPTTASWTCEAGGSLSGPT